MGMGYMPYYTTYPSAGQYQYTQIPSQNPYTPQQATQPPQPNQIPMQAQNANTTPNNGLIWVQGEQAAKSYPVAPNSTIMLMDSERDSFYLKSVDASGMPLPLRTFDYTERTQSGQIPSLMEQSNKQDFVTRQEYMDLVDKYNEIAKKITISGQEKPAIGGVADAEQPIQPVKRKRQPEREYE